MDPLIKWPGGKTGEIKQIEHMIPRFDRYIEPFFGGGALFFHLAPQRAAINDISRALMALYALIKAQDKQLHRLLLACDESFQSLIAQCERRAPQILSLYQRFRAGDLTNRALSEKVQALTGQILDGLAPCTRELVGGEKDLAAFIADAATDKFRRTLANARKFPFPPNDLSDNLLTGFAGGYYVCLRELYNDILLGRIPPVTKQKEAALFYFMREYCYGSMFRYNRDGEFNVPYGGLSYNKKNFRAKIDRMFCAETEQILRNTELFQEDFETFLEKVQPGERDFMFLDPPYDTDFSDYEGRAFGKDDQERLAAALQKTQARFILIIKNTPFIRALYEGRLHILSFDNRYTCNMRSRNDRDAEHLIITNLPGGEALARNLN